MVSQSPAEQTAVCGSRVADCASFSCSCKQDAQQRLLAAINAHQGPSWRLPCKGSCHVSTGRKATGKPVASVNACSYSAKILELMSARIRFLSSSPLSCLAARRPAVLAGAGLPLTRGGDKEKLGGMKRPSR